MQQPKVVIIGGDAAGMSAASKIRRSNPEQPIIVFEKSAFTSYSACGIPYLISGKVDDYHELIVRSPEEFREKYNIDVRIKHKVIAVDTQNNRVQVEFENETFFESYDQLLIATGGKAFCPDVPNAAAKGIFGVSTLRSGIRVDEFITENKPKNAVIVGGGYIGVEMAEALLILGLKVTLINRSDEIMNTLDPDMAAIVRKAIQNLGVTVYLKESLTGFIADHGKVTAVQTSLRQIPADIVILGMGTRPNTDFLTDSGIELSEKGAVVVDKYQKTNVSNVWAAGDCAQTFHLVSKKPFYIALGTVANKTGLVAGTNIAGGSLNFPGVVGTAVTKICSYEVARTGLQKKEIDKLGIKAISTLITAKSRASYYPDAKEIHVKLYADPKTAKILGAQIIGEEGASKRIDVLAAALSQEMTLQQIIDLDLSYAPPFSPVWDPVQTAARKLFSDCKKSAT
ncbi:MAG: FAD-dependent oxidoreductase [Flavobacterium sp.]|nr:FAD-dependent oxidoreductase [Flavobacterium sp.]